MNQKDKVNKILNKGVTATLRIVYNEINRVIKRGQRVSASELLAKSKENIQSMASEIDKAFELDKYKIYEIILNNLRHQDVQLIWNGYALTNCSDNTIALLEEIRHELTKAVCAGDIFKEIKDEPEAKG